MDGLVIKAPYEVLTVTPASPNIGAEIGNIDLKHPLTDPQLVELKRAFTEFSVLFFRDQEIGFEDQARLGEYFGNCGQHVGVNTHSKITDDPRVRKFHTDTEQTHVSGNLWHTDQSCAELPAMASILYLHTVPPNNAGDTGFASQYAAYDALSDRMKDYLDGLTVLHDGSKRFGEGTVTAVHPLICRHPESGKKHIFLGESFAACINELSREESDMILKFLFAHAVRPEWSMRFHWRPHSIAMWDNRCALHRATDDFLPHTRSGYRVQIDGIAAPVAG